MFAYIDESGNTGTYILDNAQPYFWYLVLMTRFDFHQRYERKFLRIALRQGHDHIHASAASPQDNDYFCSHVLRLIQNEELSFGVSIVEKKAHSATLFYDYFLEENPGLPVYQEELQGLWRAVIYELLDDVSQDLFWHRCALAHDLKKSETALVDLCRHFVSRLETDPVISARIHPRFKELLTDSLGWAEANPGKFSVFIKRKVDRLKSSPTVMSYVEVLKFIRGQMIDWKETTCSVVHDKSEQFEKAIKETHEAVCSFNPLAFSASGDNAGLQLCDLLLSVVRRGALELPLSRSQTELHNFLYERSKCQYFMLTHATLHDEAKTTVDRINALPLSDAQLAKAHLVSKEIDKKRKRRIGKG